MQISERPRPQDTSCELANHPRRKVRPVAVFRSFSACSGLARLRTLRNSATLCRIRLCMYAFEHLTERFVQFCQHFAITCYLDVDTTKLTVVVQVVAEELDSRDGRLHRFRVGEMPRKEHECHVAHILPSVQTRDGANLQWWFAVAVQDLGRILDRGLTSRVDEFLIKTPRVRLVPSFCLSTSRKRDSPAKRLYQRFGPFLP